MDKELSALEAFRVEFAPLAPERQQAIFDTLRRLVTEMADLSAEEKASLVSVLSTYVALDDAERNRARSWVRSRFSVSES